MADEPLPDLTRLVELLQPKEFRGHIAAAQKAAWMEWKGRKEYPGLAMRFSQTNSPNPYGFSARANRRRVKNAGDTLPFYTFSGSFKRSVMQRRPKTKYNSATVSTRFTIFGGVLNLLGQNTMRGWSSQVETEKIEKVQRTAHIRTVKGRPVRVSAYTQNRRVRTYSGGISNKTYAEEWGFRHDEILWISRRTDEILRDRLGRIGYKNGELRLKYRRRAAQETEAA